MEAVLLTALFSNSLHLDVKLATGITSSFLALVGSIAVTYQCM